MIKLTVYFENPFWIGVFQSIEHGNIRTCKVVFGAEPKDYEVYDFVLKNYYKLQFSKTIINAEVKTKKLNPKRIQREINKLRKQKGIATKAQQSIKLEQERRRIERKKKSSKEKEYRKKILFEKKKQKKKEKKKGH
ncbi:YjdF family protein [Clostridiaceae bacterium M8S5]|nr:YjdF family protein [Clostridiaceae bacterium M8S5]